MTTPQIQRASLGIAILLFVLYFGNVLMGKFSMGFRIGVVGEFLLLLATCLFFTIAILCAESESRLK